MGPLPPSKAVEGLQAAALRSHETTQAGNDPPPAADASRRNHAFQDFMMRAQRPVTAIS